MNHEERWALAVRITEDLFARYGDAALVGGVYGSTAREEDTPWSDLETLLVVSAEVPSRTDDLLVRGVPVSIRIDSLPALEKAVETPSLGWPETMGVLDATHVLRGDATVLEALVERGSAVPRDRCRDALKELLPRLVFESWGRVHSCAIRGQAHDVHVSAVEVVLDVVIGLCLLNGAWVEHDYFEGVRDAAAFDLVPEEFEVRAERLWLAGDLGEAVAHADTFVHGYLDLLESEGVAERKELFGTDLGLVS